MVAPVPDRVLSDLFARSSIARPFPNGRAEGCARPTLVLPPPRPFVGTPAVRERLQLSTAPGTPEEPSRREEERPQVQASTMQTQPVVQQPPRPKKKAVVDLDFPSDDDDED